ncbi:helix-turn-helix domain-containing protein [Pseudonocardia cypriaca]|uniref:Helix-turn-helix protein n=1 Tax=Pseudonocardia cypriaca TaxID=882449 RepID=A0A543FQ62_9PSEU|nr:helix-turn-helix domain-containing protein [Pseudonocardia cypriaca]TQM35990.1 helix-turn-helix protein [Pseudonocardia cypriaca]
MSSTALADFLRARRAQVRPGDVGLPVGVGPRRTPGLRREELAALAGVSVDYYIRLEQGKETNPSSAVLAALASALRLDDHARAHLFALADHVAHRRPLRRAPERTVTPSMRLLLENLRPCPALLLSRTSDVLAANAEGLALYHGMADWPAARRNTIRYVFRHPQAAALFGDWRASAAASVANLRTVLAADPEAPDVAELVEELSAASPEFAALWERHDVRPKASTQKVFHHPTVGELNLTWEVLRYDDDGSRRVTVHQAAPGTPDHDALSLLAIAADAGI